MVVLGLDASTTTVGYAFTENDIILDMGFIDITKQTTLKDKAFCVLDTIEDNKHSDNVDQVVIEDSLSGFAGGHTSTQTIIKLAKFNAVLCFVLEWHYDTEVVSVNPNTARKKVFGKARIKGKSAKQFVDRKSVV